MKVLYPLAALLTLCSSELLAQDKALALDDYISKNKQELYRLEEQKTDLDSDMLRDSWIAPIMLNHTNGVSEAYNNKSSTKKTSIAIDQPIFQSGGIYYGIKLAQASRIYSKYSIEVARRKLIKDAISYLMQIKQSDEKIKKQQLLIKNSEINLEQKKESYSNGQLDSGFLNSAIVERNNIIQTLYELQANKERLISKFSAISDLEYQHAKIPNLQLIEEDEFLSNNISYALSKSLSEKNRYSSDVTTTKYLPKVSIYGGYNWDDTANLDASDKKTNYATYGLKLSIPLSVSTFDDIESSKLEYLESKNLELDKKRELKATFEQVMQNIKNFDKKKLLSIQNTKIYGELLEETAELYHSGYKTEFDVEVLKNSSEVQKLDTFIYEFDKQLELLTLYEMYSAGAK